MVYVIIKETKNIIFYRHILILTDSRSEKISVHSLILIFDIKGKTTVTGDLPFFLFYNYFYIKMKFSLFFYCCLRLFNSYLNISSFPLLCK